MTTQWRRALLMLVGLLAYVGLTAWLQVQVTLPGFSVIHEALELDHKPAIPSLKRGFSVMPHPLFTYAIFVRNKDDETAIRLQRLPRQQYLVRFKARFPTVNHRVTLFLNDTLLGTAVPKDVEVAQKFRFIAPPEAVRNDQNEVRFVHQGVRAAVDYELLELRNYWLGSDGGEVRLFFDGPWIHSAVRPVARQAFVRFAGQWAVAYAVYWVLIIWLGGDLLRWPFKSVCRWLIAGHTLALAPAVSCDLVTRLIPLTIRMSPTSLAFLTAAPLAAIVGVLAMLGCFRRGTEALATSQAAFVNVWITFRQLRLLAKIATLSRWLVVHSVRTVTGGVRWLRWDCVRRPFLLFATCYGLSMVWLLVGWRGGAEQFVNAAFTFLILMVAAAALRAGRRAWATRRIR